MQHPAEEQWIAHYYGDSAEHLDEHLAACEACRQQYRALQQVLNSVDSLPVPSRAPDYGGEVWKRIRPLLPAAGRRFSWRPLAAAAALAAMITAAFVVGRISAPRQAARAPLRERVLLVAMGDHLERSKIVLAELSNLGANAHGRIDIANEQRSAEDLIESSRLYRTTAAATGDRATEALLDEIERVLLDVANGPAEVTKEELDALQRRIADTGILFKVRVFASRVNERERKL